MCTLSTINNVHHVFIVIPYLDCILFVAQNDNSNAYLQVRIGQYYEWNIGKSMNGIAIFKNWNQINRTHKTMPSQMKLDAQVQLTVTVKTKKNSTTK